VKKHEKWCGGIAALHCQPLDRCLIDPVSTFIASLEEILGVDSIDRFN
jgi:hypothetical protein